MKKEKSTADLVFVLLIVLLICGGNGLGILAAGLLWKAAGSLALSITVLVLITLTGFALAMALVAVNHRRIAEEAMARKAEAAEASREASPGDAAPPDPEAEE